MSVRYLLILLAVLKEAALGAPCTASLGLQPVLTDITPPTANEPHDGLLRQGDEIEMQVYAVNLCFVDDASMTSVNAKIREQEQYKHGSICVKPAAWFNEGTQTYVPEMAYVEQNSFALEPSDTFTWLKGVNPDWCPECRNHPGGCFAMEVKKDFKLPARKYKQSILMFTVRFTLSKTITGLMAQDSILKQIVFQAQTRPAALEIEDTRCDGSNEGGGQGTVPYRFAQATSTSTTDTTITSTTDTTTTRTGTSTTRTTTMTTTTTRCMWPCCKELRNFMDNVADFIQETYNHDVTGGGRAGVCSESCFATADDECPAGDAVPRFTRSAHTPPVSDLPWREWRRRGWARVPAPASPAPPPAPAQAGDRREIRPPLQLVAGAKDEVRECSCTPAPAPPDTFALSSKLIALMVTVSVLCAVLVQVVAGLLFPPAGARESSYTEPLLRQ